jgi:phospholipid/cholesterol/gamma-HCH transport system substrate-binding protein
MGQRAPTAGQIAVAVAFAFSCFGLLLFLWSAFGGPVPFKPEGYRVKVPVTEATQLAVESDVRISNVSVGKVKAIEVGEEGEEKDAAIATIEIEDRYAPIPEDTLATLRAKTLLGETYVELTQGDKDGPTIPEGGSLSRAQVAPSVQLDEIFRTFDERTRAAFQTWMQQAALAFKGRGDDFSAAIANLEPFAEDANRVLRVLDTQEQAVSQVIRNTGEVFGALSERRGQLRGLIQNSGTVFATTARRNQSLRELFRAFPTFLDESRLTLTRLESFSENANPLITQLHPSARALSSVLKQTGKVAPDFHQFFVGFRKVAKRGPSALGALRALLSNDLPPLLTQLTPFLRQLTPIVTAALRYKREITSFFGNVTAAFQAGNTPPEGNNQLIHYLRSAALFSPDALAFFPNRLNISRANPYPAPGTALDVGGGGQRSFPVDACAPGARPVANLDPTTPANPIFQNRFYPGLPAAEQLAKSQNLFSRIRKFAFASAASFPVGELSSAAVDAPPCLNQGAQPAIGQVPAGDPAATDYLHVYGGP